MGMRAGTSLWLRLEQTIVFTDQEESWKQLQHELLLLEAEQGHDARVAGAGQLAHHRLEVHHPRAEKET